MARYVYGTGLSYYDHAQTQAFVDDVRWEISSNARQLIASNEELAAAGIEVLSDISGTLRQGFEEIRLGLDRVSADIQTLTARVEWGFSHVIAQLGRVNDSIDELIRIAKTPEQTWAYEQFEIARDAFRRDLYEESLEHLDRAINGYGGHTGYSLEHRFHYLSGLIRLGSGRVPVELWDIASAEQHFVKAAKYARTDFPNQASIAFCAAGWAAYLDGAIGRAEQHTRDGIGCDAGNPEAHFQLAKIRMHLDNPDDAVSYLDTALSLDREYALKAYDDGDFLKYQPYLDKLIGIRTDDENTWASLLKDEIERREMALTEKFTEESELFGRLAKDGYEGFEAIFQKVVGEKIRDIGPVSSSTTYFGSRIRVDQALNAQRIYYNCLVQVDLRLQEIVKIIDSMKVERSSDEGMNYGLGITAVLAVVIIGSAYLAFGELGVVAIVAIALLGGAFVGGMVLLVGTGLGLAIGDRLHRKRSEDFEIEKKSLIGRVHRLRRQLVTSSEQKAPSATIGRVRSELS